MHSNSRALLNQFDQPWLLLIRQHLPVVTIPSSASCPGMDQ